MVLAETRNILNLRKSITSTELSSASTSFLSFQSGSSSPVKQMCSLRCSGCVHCKSFECAAVCKP
uniref:Uncharacterized protein n=1 Tax=Physcomitrium patens TaxID=3218 RepID=A0A2K1KU22_PHYPA|nr:hypothetical protein PHYPA_004243 [Physcomitrium patens]